MTQSIGAQNSEPSEMNAAVKFLSNPYNRNLLANYLSTPDFANILENLKFVSKDMYQSFKDASYVTEINNFIKIMNKEYKPKIIAALDQQQISFMDQFKELQPHHGFIVHRTFESIQKQLLDLLKQCVLNHTKLLTTSIHQQFVNMYLNRISNSEGKLRKICLKKPRKHIRKMYDQLVELYNYTLPDLINEEDEEDDNNENIRHFQDGINAAFLKSNLYQFIFDNASKDFITELETNWNNIRKHNKNLGQLTDKHVNKIIDVYRALSIEIKVQNDFKYVDMHSFEAFSAKVHVKSSVTEEDEEKIKRILQFIPFPSGGSKGSRGSKKTPPKNTRKTNAKKTS
jgi:hypothetical protein